MKRVSTADLKELLRLVHKGELPCPIDRIGLATTLMLRIADDLEILYGLDEKAVRAVLVAVLAERGR